MPRIVCQVLQRPDQVTFIWSQDAASFEPYHLAGSEAEQFYRLAATARQHLASVPTAPMDQLLLARTGYELHQLIFRARDKDAAAQRIHHWLHDLHEQNAIDSLEIVSDVPGRVPWNVVCEQAPENAADLQAFWGVRYPLTVGRRVNPLRLAPIYAEQEVLLVLDPTLSAEQQQAWKDAAKTEQGVTSAAELREALETRSPDLLCWVGGVQNGSLVLGDERITPAHLRRWIDKATPGDSEPLVFLQVSDASAASSWHEFLAQTSAIFPGLIAWEGPNAGPVGLELLGPLLLGAQPLGQLLRDFRQKQGWAGLALSAFCPPEVQFGETARETASNPLPDEPFKPFASLDREDRPLLAGRDRDIARFAGLLDEPDSRLVVLHGGFGVGKSSFLRAGVVPFLEDNSLGYVMLRDRSPDEEEAASEKEHAVLTVRASRDLAGQLAEALCAFCAQPYRFDTPLKDAVIVPMPDILAAAIGRAGSVSDRSTAISDRSTPVANSPGSPDGADVPAADQPSLALRANDPSDANDQIGPLDLWEAFEEDPDLLGRLLRDLTSRLPSDLVILIEKGEELITQAKGEDDQERRRSALQMLTRAAELAPRCKVILSVRTDYLSRTLEGIPESSGRFLREYLLSELDDDQLLEVLLLATTNEAIPFTDEVPFTKYRIAFGEEFARQLVTQVRRAAEKSRQSPVALLQAVCELLRARARIRNVALLGPIDLRPLGNLEDAAYKLVDARLIGMNQARDSIHALRDLLQAFHSNEPGGAVACDTFRSDQVQRAWIGRPEELRNVVRAAEKAGFLEAQQLLIAGQEGSYLSLANDALARVAQNWTEQTKAKKFARTKVIDMWFLALPLICLAAAGTWFFASRYFKQVITDENKALNKGIFGRMDKAKKEGFDMGVEAMIDTVYLSYIAQAEHAWQTGDVVRARTYLRISVPDDGKDAPEYAKQDTRGFEWHYLWRLANSGYATLRQEAPVIALIMSADGRVLATAGEQTVGNSSTVILWDMPTGKKRATFPTSQDVKNLAFSGDGKFLAWAGSDKLVHVVDVGTSQEVKKLAEHTDAVLALACHQKTLISAGADKKVIIWDLDKGVMQQTLKEEHTAAVHALALSSEGKRLATGGADGKIVIWDLANLSQPMKLHTIDAAAGIVRTLAFSPDGKTLVSGGSKLVFDPAGDRIVGQLDFWDVETAKAKARFQPAEEVVSLAYQPSGKMVRVASKSNFIQLWDINGPVPIGVLREQFVTGLAFAHGDSLVSGSMSGNVKVWQPTSPELLDVIHSETGPMTSIALSPDDELLAGAGEDGNVRVWNLGTSKLLKTIEGSKAPVAALAFTRLGKTRRLAASYRVGKEEGSLKIWDLEAGDKEALTATEVFAQPIAGKVAECLSFTSDGKNLAWAGSAGSVELWDVEGKRKLPTEFVGPKKTVRCLDISRGNKTLVAGSDDESIYTWEFDSGKALSGTPLKIGHGPILSTAIFGEKIVLTGGSDGSARIFQTQPAMVLGSAVGHLGPVTALAVRDKVGVFTASRDHTIKVWLPSQEPDGVRLTEKFTLRGHTGPVRSLALTRDGQTLISASEDGTIRLWRAPVETPK